MHLSFILALIVIATLSPTALLDQAVPLPGIIVDVSDRVDLEAAPGGGGPLPTRVLGVADFLSHPTFMSEVYENEYRYFPDVLSDSVLQMLRGIELRVFMQIDAGNLAQFKTILRGKPTALPTVPSVHELLEVAQEASVIVNGMQDADDTTRSMVDAAESVFGIRPSVNMYVSPPSTAGLRAHHDVQDVFILQVSGSKHWRVCEPLGGGALLPTRLSDDPNHPLYYKYTDEQLGRATCRRITLTRGDMLYLPRGTIHEPHTTSSASVHLTIGMDGDFRWMDFIHGLVRTGISTAEEGREMAQCIHPRDLNRLVPHLPLGKISSLEDAEAIQHAVSIFQAEFMELNWSRCTRTFDFECQRCVRAVIHLMHRLQVSSRERSVRVWNTSVGPKDDDEEANHTTEDTKIEL